MESDEESQPRHGKRNLGESDELASVRFVLNHKFSQLYWEYIGAIITQYLIVDPELFFDQAQATNLGFIYWLARYGSLGSGHLRWLIYSRNFDGARGMHEYMAKQSREWKCDDRFKRLTMERGDLSYIQWHVRNYCAMKFEDVVHQAVWTGRKDVIRWIQSHCVARKSLQEPTLTEMDKAAAENDLSTVKHLRSVEGDGTECSTKAMDLAAANGHLEMVQWLQTHRNEGCTTDAIDKAASNGHLEFVKWLCCNRNEGSTSLAMDGAAGNGHLHVVQWLQQQRRDRDSIVSIYHLRICSENEWVMRQFHDGLPSILINVQCQCHSPLELAACNGHFDVVKFFHEDEGDSIFAGQAIDLVATAGHLQIVQYLHENRSEGCTQAAIYGALRYGHFEVALYLYEHRPECTNRPKKSELGALVMPMLKDPKNPIFRRLLYFLRLNRKFRLNEHIMDQAAFDGDVDLVRMIDELDRGGCKKAAMDFAAMKGDMEMVKFLLSNRQEGCTADAMDGAAEADHLDIVTFLHNNRCEGCTRDAIDQAARNGHEKVVKFLHQYRKEGGSPYGMYWATMNNQIDVVRYMVEAKMPGDIYKYLQAALALQNEVMIEIFMSIPASNDRYLSCSTRTRARRNVREHMVRTVHRHKEREFQVILNRATQRFKQLMATVEVWELNAMR